MSLSKKFGISTSKEVKKPKNNDVLSSFKKSQIHKNGLNSISQSKQTEEICLYALKYYHNSRLSSTWGKIRKDIITREFIIKAVIQVPLVLTFPDISDFIDDKMIEEILKEYNMIHEYKYDFPPQYLPAKYQTYDMFYKEITKKTGSCSIPPRFLDEKMIIHAIQHYKIRCLAGVDNLSEQAYEIAFCHGIFTGIPENLLIKFRDTPSLTYRYIGSMFNLPRELQTKEYLLRIIEKNRGLAGVSSLINTDVFPIKDWDPDWFTQISNTEIRRQFIKEQGARILSELPNVKAIDENEEYMLISFNISRNEITRAKHKALIYECPSSGQTYFTVVESKIKTIKSAVTFLNNGIKKEELAYES